MRAVGVASGPQRTALPSAGSDRRDLVLQRLRHGTESHPLDNASTSTTGSVISWPLCIVGGAAVPTRNALPDTGGDDGTMFNADSGFDQGVPFPHFGTAVPSLESPSLRPSSAQLAG
jgi:hypothetical protein